MASIKSRHNKFEAKVRVPSTVSAAGGPKFLYRTLEATSRHLAKIEASAWEASLRMEWANKGPSSTEEARATLRAAYSQMLTAAAGGEFRVYVPGEDDPVAAGIDWEIERIGDRYTPSDEVSAKDQAKLTALHDAREARLGRPPVPRREYEPTLSELAADHMTWWKARGGLKDIRAVA